MTAVPPDARCGTCNLPLEENVITYKDRFFHSKCFVCSECGVGLKRVREKDGKVFCEADYLKLFAKRCHRCQEPIAGASIEANSKFYHKEHFSCIDCKAPISAEGGFLWRDGEPQCMSCNGLVCHKCNGMIHSQYVQLRVPNDDESNLTFHQHCYQCNDCKVNLAGGSTVYHQGYIYCRKCAEVRVNDPASSSSSSSSSSAPQQPAAAPAPDSDSAPQTAPAPAQEADRESQQESQIQPQITVDAPVGSSPPASTTQPEAQPAEAAKDSNVSVEVFMKAPAQPLAEPNPGVSFRKKVESRQNLKTEGFPWLISEGELTTAEADLILLEKNIPGTYFVYKPESDRSKDYFLAFLPEEHKVRHIKIQERGDGKFYLNGRDGYFDSMEALIKFYSGVEVLDTGKILDSPVDFHTLKEDVIVPGTVPEELLPEYVDYSKRVALCELISEVATKVELTTSEQSPLHTIAKKCAKKANAELNLYRVILDAPFYGYDENNVPYDKFDTKEKFEEQNYMNAAIKVLDSRVEVLQAETGRAISIEDDGEVFEVQEIYLSQEDLSTGGGLTLDDMINTYWDTSAKVERISEEDFLAMARLVLPCRPFSIIESAYHNAKKLEPMRKKAKAEGGLTKASFKEFLYFLVYFPEQIGLFRRFAKKSRDFMSVLEFKGFLRREQKIKNSEPILQLVYNLAVTSNPVEHERSLKIFGQQLSHNGEGSISIFGFVNFMESVENSIFNPLHRTVYQDMTRPLNEYFIESSHNSYLEGDQLKSASSTEAYRKILLSGCRCVELDLWDGPKNDPVIYHGYTLTTKVRAREVLETISKCAFEASPYPLILSLENHLSLPQQVVFTQYVQEIFAKDVIPDHKTRFWESNPEFLPSPESLKFKILIKNKAHPVREYAATNPDPKKVKICQELSDLVVYTKAVSFTSLETQLKCYEMSSFAEKKGMKLSKVEPEGFLAFTTGNLARSYPDGKRFDSSNPDPQAFWNVGLQLCALNYQRPDRPMQLNVGKFSQNARCGYVLKPQALREKGPLKVSELPYFTVSIRLISGHHLLHPKLKRRTSVVVEVELAGLTGQVVTTQPLPSSRTGDVLWDKEQHSFEVRVPELELLRFSVMDSAIGNKDIIGQFALPVDSLQQGYRNLPLLTPQPFGKFDETDGACLFVHVNIRSGKPDYDGEASLTQWSSESSLSESTSSSSTEQLSALAQTGHFGEPSVHQAHSRQASEHREQGGSPLPDRVPSPQVTGTEPVLLHQRSRSAHAVVEEEAPKVTPRIPPGSRRELPAEAPSEEPEFIKRRSVLKRVSTFFGSGGK